MSAHLRNLPKREQAQPGFRYESYPPARIV